MNFKYILSLIVALTLSLGASAQADRHFVRQGNRKFGKENWQEAEIGYRKALVRDSTSLAATYNLANTLYKEGHYDFADSTMRRISGTAPISSHASDYYYNLGDIAIGKKDWQGAVDAFKKSILLNPGDLEAKENYAYAKKMLDKQMGGGQGQNQQDQNKNQQDQQNQQNQQNQQDQQNQQNQQNQGQNQDQMNQNGGGEGKISPQQAQQILRAIQAKEEQTKDKVNKEKAQAAGSRQKEKNW